MCGRLATVEVRSARNILRGGSDLSSALERLQLPPSFGAAVLLVGLALCLVPYPRGADFGVLKIPDVRDTWWACGARLAARRQITLNRRRLGKEAGIGEGRPLG